MYFIDQSRESRLRTEQIKLSKQESIYVTA